MSITLKIVLTALLLAALIPLWLVPTPATHDHETNLPLGLYARTTGQSIEIGYYDDRRRWHRRSPSYEGSGVLGISVVTPDDSSRVVSAWLTPPYLVRLGNYSVTDPPYDTRDGYVKRKDLGE